MWVIKSNPEKVLLSFIFLFQGKTKHWQVYVSASVYDKQTAIQDLKQEFMHFSIVIYAFSHLSRCVLLQFTKLRKRYIIFEVICYDSTLFFKLP